MSETESDRKISQIEAEIVKVGASIERVELEITSVCQQLVAEGLSKEDVAYLRNKETQLRKEKEQLRKEKEQLNEKELILLKQRELQRDRPPLHPERDVELNRKVDLLLEATMTSDRATPQYSAAHIGNRELNRLMMDNRFFKFEADCGEESILSAEELENLSQMENEHQVVAFMTPHLEKVFQNCEIEFSVFNSEEYKWIETSPITSVYNEKPDLIICHPAIIKENPPFRSNDDELKRMRKKHSFHYGVLSKWKLRDAIGLTCEAKVSISNQGFGEVINYGAHLCHGKHGSIATRLILFDKSQCWLVGVMKGAVSDVTTFTWCDGGSTTLLRNFIRQSPLIKLLTLACQNFRLTMENDSFLGAGAFGFVFRATRSDGKLVALKVVLESQNAGCVVRLEQESNRMRQAHKACPDEVMGIEEDGFAVLEGGGALLLSKVGGHYSDLNPQSIVDSLKTLHKSGIVHGDARLDNVVSVGKKPVWIDFADSAFSLPTSLLISKKEELDLLKAYVKDKFGYNA